MKTPKRQRCPTCGDIMTLVCINGVVCWRHSSRILKQICVIRRENKAKKSSV